MTPDPADCFLCGTACYRNVINTVPDGWVRMRSGRTGETILLCPKCRWWPGPSAVEAVDRRRNAGLPLKGSW